MQYILRPLDPGREPVIFDTESIIDLARLGRYDADGVIYFDGIGYHEPTAPQPSPARPTGPTLAYVRELEREAMAAAAERDALMKALIRVKTGACFCDAGMSLSRLHTPECDYAMSILAEIEALAAS